MSLFVLLAGFYEDPDAGRRAELLECLRRNVENDRLDEIHVLAEEPRESSSLVTDYPLLGDPKIRLVPHGRRATYRDFFAHANSQLSGQRVMIANADIYTDHTLALLDGYDLADKLLCLSRWDVQPDGSARFFDFADSQDAWIFDSPIREFPRDFHLGLPGCDNRLAWEASQAGLALSNPSRSIRIFHLHLSQVRRYRNGQGLEGPYAFVPAEVLDRPDPGARSGVGESRNSEAKGRS